MDYSISKSHVGQVPWLRRLRVIFHSLLLLSGQAVTTLLRRFYFEHGGSSKWLQSLTLSAAFPILLPTLLLVRHHPASPSPAPIKLVLIFSILGLLTAANTFFFSYGILHLSISAFSLVNASQLSFNAIFSIFINNNKLTQHTLNTIVLLFFSTAVLAFHDGVGGDSVPSTTIPAILTTLGACATYSLMLSLTELTFEKVIGRRTMSTVLQTLVCTAAVATAVAVVGLAVSGEWRGVRLEMEGFEKGRVGYIMTLVWMGIARQASNIGLLVLVSEASSLFSNIISALGFPLMSLLGLILFNEKVDGIKVVTFLMAMWGLTSYFYQHYIYSFGGKGKEKVRDEGDVGEQQHGMEVSAENLRKEMV